MKLLINYSNHLYRKSQKLNSKTGKKIGLFDDVISYSPKDIEPVFFEKNKKILRQVRGNGYWLWKPYFIKKTLEIMDFGDFLFYCDSGAYFINSITPLIETSLATKQDIIVFDIADTRFIERMWSKKDAFIFMDCDNKKYTESSQIAACYSLWKKTSFTMDFIDELLNLSQDERLINDLENQCGYDNYPEFIEHRHDQSIFSLLAKKYNLTTFRDPSQFGNNSKNLYTNSNYPQIIEHTRTKNKDFLRACIKRIIGIKATKIIRNLIHKHKLKQI